VALADWREAQSSAIVLESTQLRGPQGGGELRQLVARSLPHTAQKPAQLCWGDRTIDTRKSATPWKPADRRLRQIEIAGSRNPLAAGGLPGEAPCGPAAAGPRSSAFIVTAMSGPGSNSPRRLAIGEAAWRRPYSRPAFSPCRQHFDGQNARLSCERRSWGESAAHSDGSGGADHELAAAFGSAIRTDDGNPAGIRAERFVASAGPRNDRPKPAWK